MDKRYIPEDEIVRVPAGGGYKEWFDVLPFATLGNTFDSARYTDPRERVAALICGILVDWSLINKAGEKLPITPQVVMRLKSELIEPLMAQLTGLTESFLSLTSAIQKRT